MCLQHNEEISKKERKIKHVPLAVIAVGNGKGIEQTLSAFDHVIYLDGGSTMNTSTEEFVEAINSADADKIVIMPNNKNVIKSANQAVEICKKNNVVVVESSDVVQCFYALSMDMPEESLDERIKSIKQACKELKCLSIFKSVRTCKIDGVECKEGDYVCSLGSELVASGTDIISVLRQGLCSIDNIENCEMCFAFTGRNFKDEESVQKLFEKKFSDVNLQLIPGGQEHRELVMGIV